MENTNEGTVTISLHRYKELEGYNDNLLRLEATIEIMKKDLESSENRYNRVKDLLKEYEPLIIDGEKVIREKVLANEERCNDFRKKMTEKHTKLREEFWSERQLLINEHEEVVRLQREMIENLEKSTRVITTIMTLIGVVIGVISTLIIQTIF